MKSDDRPETLEAIAELMAMPGAEYCAQNCAWVPGSGLCSRRDCASDCIFRAGRAAEAAQLQRRRQRRRAAHRPFALRVRDAARRACPPVPDRA
jgi:hypothetical protein